MPDSSPLRLRRAASASLVNTTTTVNPSSVFGYEPWAPEPVRYAGQDERTAGSDGVFVGNDSLLQGKSNAKRVYDETFFSEPETPLRKVRGQSVSYSGLVTPQSTTRSFSTTSLPMNYTPDHAYNLPSPLDTPLATPMSGTLDNPFDMFYEPKLFNGWKHGYDFPTGQSTYLSPSHLMRSNNSVRSPSASTAGNRSDDDSLTTSVSSGPTNVANRTDSNGVNPFYSPPAFLRDSQDSSVQLSASDFDSISDIGQLNDSFSDPTDAGVSPKADNSDSTNTTADDLDEDEESGTARQIRSRSTSSPAASGPAAEAAAAAIAATVDDNLFHSQLAGMHDPALDGFFEPTAFENAPINLNIAHSDEEMAAAPNRQRSASTASNVSTEDKPFKCMSCHKGFRRMEHLRRHQKTHTLERPFACTVPDCGRRFSRTDNLKAHILTHTKKSGRNVYVEGLAETKDIKPIKRRKSRKNDVAPIAA